MALKPKLSILIASMPERFTKFQGLLDCLEKQYNGDEVEIGWDISLDYNIGIKRNKLLGIANGDYIVFIDDDDHISSGYIAKILTAIETGPDCVGISGTITTNGADERQWHISKEYKSWYEQRGIYYRTPNHISPVKRELALKAGFPEIEHGEDYAYSMRLLPLLKTEVKISGNIYHYDYHDQKVYR